MRFDISELSAAYQQREGEIVYPHDKRYRSTYLDSLTITKTGDQLKKFHFTRKFGSLQKAHEKENYKTPPVTH